MAYTSRIDLEIPQMAQVDTVKQERMHIRLDALSKQKLERAATYAHKSLSEFVLGQALHAADEVIAIYDVVIDALNDRATEFYQQFGFIPMLSQPLKLFLPLGSVVSLIDE